MTNIKGDINNLNLLKKTFKDHNPDIVFHLAAQPIVRKSYDLPHLTFETNFMGTLNILECLRKSNKTRECLIITTDKVYKNKEMIWGYRENDELGGIDPYSASKSCVEILVNSYKNSFFHNSKTKIASARAGNVIGGGDWSQDRIIPDSIKALLRKKPIIVRNPHSTRPWQHVLEPLNGYLKIVSELNKKEYYSTVWNFGPRLDSFLTVKEIVEILLLEWGSGSWKTRNVKKESKLLNLDWNKAYLELGWKPVLNIQEAVRMVVDWYKNYNSQDVYELCKNQIELFSKIESKQK